ncbi:hypothetical protein B0G62_10499 [Paraburkholderia eburnea]|uniref:Uncharacterized protein n=1 Tax=Paraburkholderia eburnea TaxID=1189126 RepID=A0A2S4MDJ0_9BURK|nr:hypothetical protein [Paraburkholderia eburnea]POR52802.1 hypothetical protein B0G62_10499 [Paraburkholderia eburnea]PRZ23670.1 hypothetical protein BX588_10499 [Paraburkholderia eburnea]
MTMLERKRRREAFMEQSRRYLFAKEPTPEQLHGLAQSFADMVSSDRGERVVVMIGGVQISRGRHDR